VDSQTEIHRLRRGLRDLVALSTIPAAWVGRDPAAIAAGLADVLVGSLRLDFAFVRLCDPNGGAAVDATRGDAPSAFLELLERRVTCVGPFCPTEIVADVGGEPSRRGVIIPVGVNGEGGLVAAACDRAEFPDETDQLLLSVAGNHAATAFQSARLIEAQRRAQEALSRLRIDLETRVAERTAELSESEKRYRHIFESSGVSIFEEDFSRVKAAIDDLRSTGVRDFRAYFAAHPQFVRDAITMVKIVDVNTASVRMFAAKTKDQLLASLDRIFVAETHGTFVEELVAIGEGRTFVGSETVLQTLNSERLTALFTVTFPQPTVRFDSVLVTIMDITERKQAEYLTGQVFESSPDRVSIIGRDFRYQRVNPVFERYWGVPAEKAVGMRVPDVVGIEVFEARVRQSLDRCFAGEDVRYAGWFVNARGRRYVAVSFSPLRPDSERVEAALVIGRDLTEHVLAVEALQELQAELAHVTRVTTLNELAVSIAHEVNQPLTAVVADATASLNWLAATPPDLDRVRDALDAIVTDGHRAADVIQRVRQLAKKSGPLNAEVDPNDVVRDVVPLLRAELRHHDVSLTLQLASDVAPVLADRVQLQQVILNLVMNAIEAMSSVTDRPRELVIRSERHDPDHIRVVVQDTGVGLAANLLEQMFSAFFSTKPGGMGMGLSISRSIVEAHGGRLWATPNEPHGAIFHFSLPVGPAPAVASLAPGSRPSAS